MKMFRPLGLALLVATVLVVSHANARKFQVSTVEEFKAAMGDPEPVVELLDNLDFGDEDLVLPAVKSIVIYGNCRSEVSEAAPRSKFLVDTNTPIAEGSCGFTFGLKGAIQFDNSATNLDTQLNEAARTESWRRVFLSNLIIHKTATSNTTTDRTYNYASLFLVNSEYSGFPSLQLWESALFITNSTLAGIRDGISLTIGQPIGPEKSISILNTVRFVECLKAVYVTTVTGFQYNASLFASGVSTKNANPQDLAQNTVQLKPNSTISIYSGKVGSFSIAPEPKNYTLDPDYKDGLKRISNFDFNSPANADLMTPASGTVEFLTDLMVAGVPGASKLMDPFSDAFPPPMQSPPPVIVDVSPPANASNTTKSPSTSVRSPPPPVTDAALPACLGYFAVAVVALVQLLL